MINSSSLLRRPPASLLAVGLLVLTLSGCGGSGGDSTERALTKAQYIKQADAICNKAKDKQLRGLTAYVKKHPESREIQSAQEAAVVAVGLPPDRVGIEEIRSLNPPTAHEQEISSLLDEMEAALKKSEEDPTTVVTGVRSPFEEVNQRAAKYGFEACNLLP
jgi:hypothetical protein